MRVRYKNEIEVYLVIGIEISKEEIKFTLHKEPGYFMFANINQLEFISYSLPSNWVIVNNTENIKFIPKTWDDKFWKYSFIEEVLDGGSSEGLNCYYKELEIMFKDEFGCEVKTNDDIVLKIDFPFEELRKGDIGRVINIYNDPEIHYELEFKKINNDIIRVLAMPDDFKLYPNYSL